MTIAMEREGIDLLLAAPDLATDNAAMIGYAAALKLARNVPGSDLALDIDPTSHPAWVGGAGKMLDAGGQVARAYEHTVYALNRGNSLELVHGF
jgi:ribosomal protein L31